MIQRRSLAYLCLEAPREGQASYVHVHEICAGLKRRGWSIELFAPSYSDSWERPGALRRALQYAYLQVKLGLRIRAFDAIYVRAHPLAFPLAMSAKMLGVPVVHEVNGAYGDLYVAYPAFRRLSWLLDAMQRAQYRWASGLISVTPQLSAWLRKEIHNVGKSIAVIANGVNTLLFSPRAQVPDYLAGKIPERFVVFFGGLTRWHGVPLMLEALRDPRWPRGVSLVVVGDGPEAHHLVAAAPTEPRLIWLGRLPYAEIGGIVRRALAGLVPISDPDGRSSIAGLAPLKLYETLACRIPAIVTDFPGQADLIREHRCGICVQPESASELAAAVAHLDANPDEAREMGKRGEHAVTTSHSWDIRAADTAAFLERIC